MKITEQQLKELNEKYNKVNQLKLYVGDLEGQKHVLLHNLISAQESLQELQETLEEQYGKINIDLTTGEYEAIKEE